MKTFDEIIRTRRSVRNYDPDKNVSREMVEQLIAAAVEAPSWKNQQTSRYHIVVSPEMRERLKACLWSQNQLTVKDVPVLIVTTFVKGVVGFEKNGTPSNELGDGWGIYDLGLQNALLLLKATDLGLDSIVLGLRDAEAIRTLLDIPQEEIVVSVIGIGCRSKESARPARKQVADIAKFY
ncbi:MAG: nitroreductase family protein [Alistipes sp.]|nr:nitroreductase family protein [Alistipes sp.]